MIASREASNMQCIITRDEKKNYYYNYGIIAMLLAGAF